MLLVTRIRCVVVQRVENASGVLTRRIAGASLNSRCCQTNRPLGRHCGKHTPAAESKTAGDCDEASIGQQRRIGDVPDASALPQIFDGLSLPSRDCLEG